jgi:hypothetical protein
MNNLGTNLILSHFDCIYNGVSSSFHAKELLLSQVKEALKYRNIGCKICVNLLISAGNSGKLVKYVTIKVYGFQSSYSGKCPWTNCRVPRLHFEYFQKYQY